MQAVGMTGLEECHHREQEDKVLCSEKTRDTPSTTASLTMNKPAEAGKPYI